MNTFKAHAINNPDVPQLGDAVIYSVTISSEKPKGVELRDAIIVQGGAKYLDSLRETVYDFGSGELISALKKQGHKIFYFSAIAGLDNPTTHQIIDLQRISTVREFGQNSKSLIEILRHPYKLKC